MDNYMKMIMLTYSRLKVRVDAFANHIKRPMTLAEKILYAHLYDESDVKEYKRGDEYANFRPDRVAMQDATAQMALLQFMNAGQKKTAVPSSVHCDHLIQAYEGARPDLESALFTNQEVYNFLQSVSDKYGIDFWKPGAGIIHQVVLENYAFPGGMMVGTDSHTPNAGGLGMIAIGVGGADAVDVMTDMPWELKMPRLIGVRLTGKMRGWTSPKDVILKLAGILTVKGATNAIIEYFGPGTKTISATGKATICNMGAEVGATTSIFPFDNEMKRYLLATGREAILKLAENVEPYLKADDEAIANPEKYYDSVIEIDLSTLEPYINGPFTPDAATPLSELAEKIRLNNYPEKVEVGLIGSCTNSSYQDLDRTASIARQVKTKRLKMEAELIINPGSEQIRKTAERDGITQAFEEIGGVLMANACGPCIGQWKRITDDNEHPNSIVTSFNRNFAKRADGNPNTHAFVASPEMVMALTIAGKLTFNPITDKLQNEDGEWVYLDQPHGNDLPANGFEESDGQQIDISKQYYLNDDSGGRQVISGNDSDMNDLSNLRQAASGNKNDISDESSVSSFEGNEDIVIAADSQRLQRLEPFAPWDGNDLEGLPLLIKAKGKCTTDHISMAGSWLRFRGHLENISGNLLMGAVNAFNSLTNSVRNVLDGSYGAVSAVAKAYKEKHISSIVVAEDNYGEGSSREHAAMEPRFLNVRVILAKSFARIHETNLKKQGMLAITFANHADYDRIREGDIFTIDGLENFFPESSFTITIKHSDNCVESFEASHTYNETQVEWFRAGSALNYNKQNRKENLINECD